jgi:CO/xanthine dehydrogenase Mo-binding subunit
VLTLHDALEGQALPLYGDDNMFGSFHYARGDVKAAFESAARVVEGEYQTGYQEQMYMEPQGLVAEYSEGRITVRGSMQCPYYIKNALIQGFGWPGEKFRVVQSAVGGAFGGKEEYPSLLGGQAAFAAYKTGKPVQLVLERSEDVEATTKRHPSVIRLKTALDGDGRVTGLIADIKLNAGAYAGMSTVVLQRTMFNIAGVYNIPNVEVSGKAIATNTVPTGAFRGFGAPQAIFAIETHMDRAAKESGRNPLEFKTKHMAAMGDPTVTGGKFRYPVPLPELIETVDSMADYRRKAQEYSASPDRLYRGIGMSLFLHGCGFTGSGERDHINAVVKLEKNAEDHVFIRVAGVDMGQGLRTTFRKIVAAALQRPIDTVNCDFPDTDLVPDSGPTVASRSVMIVGKLLSDAAEKLKKEWREGAAQAVTEKYRHPEYLHWEDRGGEFFGDAYPTYSWGVNAVEVEVDPLTLEIRILGAWAAFDVGKAVDQRIMKGQIDGGMIQGLGYATIEVMQGKDGRLLQRGMTDYTIPTAMDAIAVKSRLVDNPYDLGPFGAKGAGELTLIGAAPALVIAVSNALRIPVTQLPVTPEYLLEALK